MLVRIHAGVVSAHAHIRTQAYKSAHNRLQSVNFKLMAMVLLKWPCTAVWLICMTSLLHLVLSYGENFVHATKIQYSGCARMNMWMHGAPDAFCHISFSLPLMHMVK